MIFKQFLLIFLISRVLSTSIEEVQKKISEYQALLGKLEIQCGFDEFYDILEGAEFHQDIKEKCPDLDDLEDCQDPPEKYDFVVVGGGTTGSVMARRLSEVPDFSVFLMEMGSKPNALSKIPALNPFLHFTDVTEKMYMEPEEGVGYAMKDHKILVSSGNAMGGSSVMTSGVVNRVGTDFFESFGGDWCGDAAKYFMKSEKANISGAVDSGNHNFDGPLSHSDAHLSPLGSAFIKCGAENGLPEIDDTGVPQNGVSRVKSLTSNGRRQNHAEAFLDNVSDRKNLFIKEGCRIYKILINENLRAYGVQYVQNNIKKTVLARKEVILSLGTFHTPQILMLSGVGPKKHLEEIGVKCLVDSPVGETLHDVIAYVGLLYKVNSTAPACLQDLINKENTDMFLKDGTGPLASPNSVESTATQTLNGQTVKIQLVNRGWALDEGRALRQTVGISKEFYRRYFKALEGKRTIMVVPIVPAESTGRIKLKCANPFEDPIIHGCYYDNPKDRDTMVAAIKYTMDFMKCESFKKFNLTFCDKKIPGCEHKKGDEYFRCITKYLTVSYQDQTGTCKMGPKTDPKAVCDPNGVVYGVEGLRCIGAAIVPKSVPGGSVGVVTMMVEKIADAIKAQYGFTTAQYCPK